MSCRAHLCFSYSLFVPSLFVFFFFFIALKGLPATSGFIEPARRRVLCLRRGPAVHFRRASDAGSQGQQLVQRRLSGERPAQRLPPHPQICIQFAFTSLRAYTRGRAAPRSRSAYSVLPVHSIFHLGPGCRFQHLAQGNSLETA